MMKILLVSVFSGLMLAMTGPDRTPSISKQFTEMVTHKYDSPSWDRHVFISNPLNRPVWVYLECEEHLMVNPVSVKPRHTSEVVIPGVGPDEQCLLNHWAERLPGRTPETWRP